MAKFIGSIDEFISLFGNTLLTKAVEAYTKEYREMVGCQHKGKGGIDCSRILQTAHNHEAGYDRRKMAIEILKGYENGEGTVEVDLNEFLQKFHAVHQPLHKTVKILCSKHHGAFDTGVRTRSKSNISFRYGMPERRTIDKGSYSLEFVPSLESIIKALKETGKCYIHYHLLGGTSERNFPASVVVKEWNNTKGKITSENIHNNIRSKRFVKNYRDRIEKIVVSIYDKCNLESNRC